LLLALDHSLLVSAINLKAPRLLLLLYTKGLKTFTLVLLTAPMVQKASREGVKGRTRGLKNMFVLIMDRFC